MRQPAPLAVPQKAGFLGAESLGITLAAGHGTRLFPLTLEKSDAVSLAQGTSVSLCNINAVPKPLSPIANTPAIASTFQWLRQAGASRIVVGTGAFHSKFEPVFQAMKDPAFHLADDTGNAPFMLSRIAEREMRAGYQGVILYANADILCNADPRPMVEAHLAQKPLVSIMTSPIRGVEPRYSSVETEGKVPYEQVKTYQHKVEPKEARDTKRNASFYVISPEFFDWLKASFPNLDQIKGFDLSEHVFPKLAQEGHLFSYRATEFWRDVGTLGDYYDAQRFCLEGISNHLKSGRFHSEPRCHEVDGYMVHGPALIAEKSAIGAGSVIGPGTVIGSGWTIGKNAVIESCTLWPDHLGRKDASQFFSVADKVVIRRCLIGSGNINEDCQNSIIVHNGSTTVTTPLLR
jgi:NDP-sugar pyrophosphorylase family protein